MSKICKIMAIRTKTKFIINCIFEPLHFCLREAVHKEKKMVDCPLDAIFSLTGIILP